MSAFIPLSVLRLFAGRQQFVSRLRDQLQPGRTRDVGQHVRGVLNPQPILYQTVPARLAEQFMKDLLVPFDSQPAAKSPQRADIRQMLVAPKPEQQSIGEIGFRLPILQAVMKHEQFELQTENRFDRGPSFVTEERLNGLAQSHKINVKLSPPGPMIKRHQLIKQPPIIVQELGRRIRI